MKIRISVTSEHISAGHKHSTVTCPIALAVAARIKGDLSVHVGQHLRIHEGLGRHIYQYQLPVDAIDRLVEFDATGEMEPFRFDLEIGVPAESPFIYSGGLHVTDGLRAQLHTIKAAAKYHREKLEALEYECCYALGSDPESQDDRADICRSIVQHDEWPADVIRQLEEHDAEHADHAVEYSDPHSGFLAEKIAEALGSE